MNLPQDNQSLTPPPLKPIGNPPISLPQETGIDEILRKLDQGEYLGLGGPDTAKQALLQLFEKEAVDGSTYHSPGLSNNTKVITLSKLRELLGGAE